MKYLTSHLPIIFISSAHFPPATISSNTYHSNYLTTNLYYPRLYLSLTMFSSNKKLHFITHLSNWAQAILHKVKSRCKRSIRGRRLKGFPNSFDHFAAMEISNQLRQVFKLIDANRDGKISSSELRELLLCLGYEKSTATKEAEGMVKELDCNGDGYIDMEEFMEAMRSRGEEDGLMDAFLMFDTDGDGFISAKELQRVLISLGYAKCSLDECLRMIRGVDKNGDGLVDFEEFGSMMTGHQI